MSNLERNNQLALIPKVFDERVNLVVSQMAPKGRSPPMGDVPMDLNRKLQLHTKTDTGGKGIIPRATENYPEGTRQIGGRLFLQTQLFANSLWRYKERHLPDASKRNPSPHGLNSGQWQL